MSSPPPLAHDALVYSSDEEFVAAAAPFLGEGCDNGERAFAVTTPHNASLLRDALGEAWSRVRFIDAGEWYERPGVTIEGYREALAEDPGTPARVIGEVKFGEASWQQRAWTRYEAVLNRVFADQAAWVVCPYDRRTLPTEVVEHAARTHPHVWRGADRGPSQRYAGEAFALSLPERPIEGAPILTIGVRTADGLRDARQELEAALARVPLTAQRRLRGIFAIHEVLANVIEHGAGAASLSVWHRPDRVVCEVAEAGPGPGDPLGAYVGPTDPTRERGLGLWIVHQLCEAVDFATTERGSRMRLSFVTDTAVADTSPVSG